MDFLRTALGILDENIARDFEAIDENGDGLVSKQESFKALQALDVDRFKYMGGGTVTEVNHCEIEEIDTAMWSRQLKKMLVSTGSPIDTIVASEVIDLTDASNVCERSLTTDLCCSLDFNLGLGKSMFCCWWKR